MNTTTVIIGAVVILLGVVTLISRLPGTPESKKHRAMKERWGTAGSVIHFVAYVVVPIVAGVIFVTAGLRGVALF